MAFWGAEVKPGKPYTHCRDPSGGKLRITQATVGTGNSTKKIVLQCNVGKRSPVLLCSLIPDKAESCRLDLEFEEEDDVVFSVIGPRSVYIAGYHSGHGKAGGGDNDIDSYGEDIGETETEGSGSFDSDEYEDDFIDDGDIEMYDSDSSPRPNCGVVIEEIVEDDKQVKDADNVCSLKKSGGDGIDDRPDSDRQMVVKRYRQMVLESEDEDGFPINTSHKQKSTAESIGAGKDIDHENSSPEKLNDVRSVVSDNTGKNQEQIEKTNRSSSEKSEEIPKRKEKLKKKKKDRVKKTDVDSAQKILTDVSKHGDSKDGSECHGKEDNAVETTVVDTHQEQDDTTEPEAGTPSNIDETTGAKSNKKLDKTRKKKKRSKETISGETKDTIKLDENDGDNTQNTDDRGAKKRKKSKKSKEESKDVLDVVNEDIPPTETKEQDVQPQQTRTFSNGLIVEEIQMGKPDGKKASSGKKVSLNYIGKLKNGKIFDSNIGKEPFTFRLGIGQVIKGWDVGVNGMRVGDKRRLTIPPSMGYGSKKVGVIPANSWLVFDVELVDAK